MKKDLDILGLGSVVVDLISPAQAIALPESKVRSGEAQRYAGGVVLNHLAWAAALGARAALGGLGAGDEPGRFLRRRMDELGVDHRPYDASQPRTSVARIFVDKRGERAIYMDPGPIAATRPAHLSRLRPWLRRAKLFSTEVSLLPLPTVAAALRAARAAGARTVLDLDLPPSTTASLGTRRQLDRVLALADVVKASVDAACELVPGVNEPAALALALHRRLRKRAGRQWVALTAGSRGAAASDGRLSLFLPAFKGVASLDSTGAGDAFLGGLIAALAKDWGLKKALRLACACGAACVSQRGAVPEPGAAARALRLAELGGLKARPSAKLAALRGPAEAYLESALAELGKAAKRVDLDAIVRARDLILASAAQGGRLHLTGIGKGEPVARFAAASYSSTGTPAFFLHGTEAVHGSGGQLKRGEVLIALSNSGQTAELRAAVAQAKRLGCKVVAVTGGAGSWLARSADVVLAAKVDREGDALGLAPRNSVLAQVLVLNALGVALQDARGFSAALFRRYHPAGRLGRRA